MKHVSKRLSGVSRAVWMLLAGTILGSAVFLATSFGPTGSTASRENSSPSTAPASTAELVAQSTQTATGIAAMATSPTDAESTEGAVHPDNFAKDAPRPDTLDSAPVAGSSRFVMPLRAWGTFTDRYGASRGGGLVHGGIDLALEGHLPVLASCAGIVSTNYTGTYGYHVTIDCGEGWATLYAHLSEILVKDGQRVVQNGVIGLTGTTGFSTGEHLHFEIHYYGGRVNPEYYLDFKIPPGTPLSSGPIIWYGKPGTGIGAATATTEASPTAESSATAAATATPTKPTNTPTITPTPTNTPTPTHTPTPRPPTPTRTPTKAPVFIP